MTRQKNGLWKLTDSEMNYFSILANEARERYEQIGMTALAKHANEIGNEIFDELDKLGYYDGI